MSSTAIAAEFPLLNILTRASDDILFRSSLKYEPETAYASLDISPELRAVLMSRDFLPVRRALFGNEIFTNAEVVTVTNVHVAIYVATAVAVAA